MTQVVKSYEPMQTLTNQGLYGNDNKNVQIGYMKSIEPQIFDKKQEVTLKNATSLQIGEQESKKIGPKSVININFFLEHRSEILAMKEQVQMIRSFIAA